MIVKKGLIFGDAMKVKVLFLISCSFLLCACAKKPIDNSYLTLENAANSINQSLVSLKETEQAAYPPQTVAEPPSPNTYGMAIPTSLDWDGPVEPLVKQIAYAANYQVHTLGKKPTIPIIVSVSAKDELIGNILRNVGYQCGNRASIVVFPSTRIIELRYTNS
jgi:defect in organelle trafficking protein DotD